LGHLIFENLIKGNDKKTFRDMPKVIKHSDSICKKFQIGNQTKVRLKKKEYSTTKTLDRIQKDLCRPNITKITCGEQYFMLIVDDYTRLT
jgi:hypothetical protein